MSSIPATAQDVTTAPAAGATALSSYRARWFVLLVVWAISAAYVASRLHRGWVPHDEGILAQSAERVLRGELPHRDFDELYSGGLSFLNAFTFRALGTNLFSLRVPLFILFLAWVPAVYSIASRFAGPLAAGFVTLLAVVWSLPNYSAALPSWFNLFFATFGAVALLRHLDTNSRLSLFVAGLCGGISFLAKLSGLYYVAAALLFLAFREQWLSRAAAQETKRRSRLYFAVLFVALCLYVSVLYRLVSAKLGPAELIQFLFPGLVLALFVLGANPSSSATSSSKRFSTLLRLLAPFLAGVLLPIAIFLIPYAQSGSLADFYRGIFVLPARRFAFAAVSPRGLEALLGFVPPGILLGLVIFGPFEIRRWWRAAVVAAFAVILVISRENSDLYQLVWDSLILLIPFTVFAGVALLKTWQRKDVSPVLQQQVMLLLSLVAMCSLVQLPFAAPIYFCYVAPLIPPALLAMLSSHKRPPRFLIGSLLCFYLIFAVALVNPSFIYAMGYRYIPDPETQRLTLPRAGNLRVAPAEASVYEELIPLIQQHAAGEFIYAAPDSPEVYFLSACKNPTRSLLDFFDDPAAKPDHVLNAIEAHGIKVAVIRNDPKFSPPMPQNLRAALTKLFPNSETVSTFEVRWRP